MSSLRSYHCNNCGALLFVGEKHTCDPERLKLVDKIADFFSSPCHHEHDHSQKESELDIELRELMKEYEEKKRKGEPGL
jgi:hypothetical protein